MFSQFLVELVPLWKVALLVAGHGVFAALFFLVKMLRRPVKLHLPIVGDPNAPDFREAMELGAQKVSRPPLLMVFDLFNQ